MLCIPMLMTTEKDERKRGTGGKNSVENSFEEDLTIKRVQER